MFLSEMSEAKQQLIEIKDFDGDAIKDLVNFAYSSKLTLTVDNVQPLLYAACILQVITFIQIPSELSGVCFQEQELSFDLNFIFSVCSHSPVLSGGVGGQSLLRVHEGSLSSQQLPRSPYVRREPQPRGPDGHG